MSKLLFSSVDKQFQIDSIKMLLLVLLSSLSFCLAEETTALAGPSPNIEDNLFVGKIRSFIKELKEYRTSNKELLKEMSNTRKNIEEGVQKVMSIVTNNLENIVELSDQMCNRKVNLVSMAA